MSRSNPMGINDILNAEIIKMDECPTTTLLYSKATPIEPRNLTYRYMNNPEASHHPFPPMNVQSTIQQEASRRRPSYPPSHIQALHHPIHRPSRSERDSLNKGASAPTSPTSTSSSIYLHKMHQTIILSLQTNPEAHQGEQVAVAIRKLEEDIMQQENARRPCQLFQCNSCGKGFERKSDMKRHKRTHSSVRPHVCEHAGCGKRFVRRSTLTVHMRVHTGEKPYMCEYCKNRFGDSSSVAKHRKMHSRERPYKCSYAGCQKTFTCRATITRHQDHYTGTLEETAAALATRSRGNNDPTASSIRTMVHFGQNQPAQPIATFANGIVYNSITSANETPSFQCNP